MKKFIILLLIIVYTALSDEIYIYKTKNANYIQTEEFLIADGSSIVGPVKLLPSAITKHIKVEPSSKNIKIKAILLEEASQDWKKNIIEKNISLEGEGRFIRGKVKKISDNYIIIDTSRGTIITTLPDFPEKITSILKWEELFSPYIMIKIDSTFSGDSTFNIIYQINGINWEPSYIYNKDNQTLEYFIKIKNRTNINFHDIKLTAKHQNKTILKLEKTNIEPKSTKLIKVKTIPIKNPKTLQKLYLPKGEVAVYSKGILLEIKSLKSLFTK